MNLPYIKLTILLIFTCNIAAAQLKVANNQVLLDMNYALGMKPGSVKSVMIAKRSQLPPDVLSTYPVTTGKPQNISKQIEYYYIQNGMQFAFQNYCEKKTSKELFLKEVNTYLWNLADTVYLSRKPIQCGFSVLAGLENDSIPVFIVDANNNNDYSDEVVRPINKHIYNAEAITNASIPITLDRFLDGKLSQEAINCYVSSDSPENQVANLSFCFPAFKYNSFLYNGKPYVLWTPMLNHNEEVFLQAGNISLSLLKEENPIKSGQYVVLDGVPLKLKGLVGNNTRLILEGVDYSGFDLKSVPAKGSNKNAPDDLRSSQVGFMAPQVEGARIGNQSSVKELVSLNQMKGKYVFIDFWSTTCAPCIADFPKIMKSYDKFTRAQFEIIGIVDERSVNGAKNLIAQHQLKWPNIKTNTAGTMIKGYNVVSYPTSYLVDKEGKIIAQNLRGQELLKKLNALIK